MSRSPYIQFFLFIALTAYVSTSYAQRAPDSSFEFADFVEPDFPFITTTLDAGTLGAPFPKRNVAVRCLVLMLGNDTYACFDTDLLRIAATWHGDFMSMLTMPQVSYHKAGNKGNGIPEILGEPLTATGVYPGWLLPDQNFVDPRPSGPNPDEIGRGPVGPELGYWNGVYLAGEKTVLMYKAGPTQIEEVVTSLKNYAGVVRTFRMGEQDTPLRLVLAEYENADQMTVQENRGKLSMGTDTMRFMLEGDTEGVQLAVEEGRYVVATVAPKAERVFGVAAWKTTSSDHRGKTIEISLDVPSLNEVHSERWPETVTTSLVEGDDGVLGYVIDHLELPIPNPWKRNVRIAGLDFFSDGRAAVSTFEGDIWIISDIPESGGDISWKRFASGLYEPLSLSIVDDQVYTFGREGIIRFNDIDGNGEAEYYENFSNGPIQTIESREYPHSMHPRPGGGFYVSKGAALNNGPKTNKPIMTGFRAGGPHSGTILKISPDGKTVERFATGLREPYIGVHPDRGWVTASDQQGNFVPSSPIYFVQEGDYYGVPASAHQDIPPAIAEPLTWVPHNVDRSGTEQVWITSDQFGPLNGALIHLSYGKPGIYLVYAKEEEGKLTHGAFADIPIPFTGPLMEGAIHPLDGQLYMGGFQVWDSNAKDVSNLYRMRYVGGDFTIPKGFKKGQQGVILEFDVALDKSSVEQKDNYDSKRWNYKRTQMYGSGIFRRSGIPGKENVRVANAALSMDGKKVFVQLQDMQNVMQMELVFRLKTASGTAIKESVYFSWHNESVLDLVAEGFYENALVTVDQNEAEVVEIPQKVATLERGQEIYQQIGCIGCHSIDGTTEGRTGPTFLGLLGRVREFNDGTSQVADEAYVRESIYDPAAKEVKGLDVEMPSYVGLLDESDIDSIILFIRSLEASN